MKININVPLLDAEGVALPDFKDGVRGAITYSLLTLLEGDDKLSGEDKNKNFLLWWEKIKDKEEVDLTAEEIVLIKKRVGIPFSSLIVGQIYKVFNV